MTPDPIDTRKTALEMMNLTRRAWQIGTRGYRGLPGAGRDGREDFAWPMSEAAQANGVSDDVERFLRAQE